MFQLLLDEKNLIEDYSNPSELFPVSEAEPESLFWLWQQCRHRFSSEYSLVVRIRILKSWWASMGLEQFRDDPDLFGVGDSKLDLSVDLLDEIQSGRCGLMLTACAEHCLSEYRSFEVGAMLIDWFSQLGIDVESCLANELKLWPEGWGSNTYAGLPGQKIVFEGSGDQDWILGFEWILDAQAPAYLLISQYRAIAMDQWRQYDYWPFEYHHHFSHRKYVLQASRFERRTASKARKERARTGQKRPKSKMPGTWTW